MRLRSLRDELFWPGMMADFPVATDGSERRVFNFRAHEPDVNDLRGRIESVIPYFCANLSCIHANCPLHRKGFIRLALAHRQVNHACLRNFSKRLSLPSCGRTTSYEQRLSSGSVPRLMSSAVFWKSCPTQFPVA